VSVPPWFILRPDRITTNKALLVKNVELRRLMIERLGYERFIRESQAQPIRQDDFGSFTESPCAVITRSCWLKSQTRLLRRWFATEIPLRVPPTVRSAREAVAWTFALEADEYPWAIRPPWTPWTTRLVAKG
jgi:hypothetical protein